MMNVEARERWVQATLENGIRKSSDTGYWTPTMRALHGEILRVAFDAGYRARQLEEMRRDLADKGGED